MQAEKLLALLHKMLACMSKTAPEDNNNFDEETPKRSKLLKDSIKVKPVWKPMAVSHSPHRYQNRYRLSIHVTNFKESSKKWIEWGCCKIDGKRSLTHRVKLSRKLTLSKDLSCVQVCRHDIHSKLKFHFGIFSPVWVIDRTWLLMCIIVKYHGNTSLAGYVLVVSYIFWF